MIGPITIQRITAAMVSNLKKELRDQGHYLTGALENSIRARQSGGGNTIVSEIDALDYADDLFEGVRPEHIDAASHLPAMIEYAKKRFKVSGKQAIRAGAAIARKHAREGIPTANSYNFSSTGERLFANVESYNKNEAEYNQIFEKQASNEIDADINRIFDQTIF